MPRSSSCWEDDPPKKVRHEEEYNRTNQTKHTSNMYKIICNYRASRQLDITETQLQTMARYNLFSDLLDSNGIVSESVLEKLRLNLRSLLEANHEDADLLDSCHSVIFHDNMKAFGLHQLILLYIDWEKSLSPDDEQSDSES